ncbi:DNA-primase RepB domain-containing protein [Edaphobacter aggregans]|uniref:DNA-primase RepB domain-containing protein n=1 Tax=Edaphobacter aggregans TaxID=570835 RepID=UPI001FDFD049|nr:DNA-primase RepB domain-containing protein [Edaphobacter aggregans]
MPTPAAADWRRFGRLPGFTNSKPKYRKPDGLFPFVRLHSHTGQQYPMAQAFEQAGDNEALRNTGAGTRGEAVAKFFFSPKGTEVIEPIP